MIPSQRYVRVRQVETIISTILYQLFNRRYGWFTMESTFDFNNPISAVLVPLEESTLEFPFNSSSEAAIPELKPVEAFPSSDDSELLLKKPIFDQNLAQPLGVLLDSDSTSTENPSATDASDIAINDQITGEDSVDSKQTELINSDRLRPVEDNLIDPNLPINPELLDKVPLDVIDRIVAGETVELIIEVNDDEIQTQVTQLRQTQGLASEEADTASITEFKAQSYQNVKDGLFASVSSDISELSEYSHLPLSHVEVNSLEDLVELLENENVDQVYLNQFLVIPEDEGTSSQTQDSVVDPSEPVTELPATEASEAQDELITPQLVDSLPQINQPEAAAAGYTGDGVTIAVLDTGADPNAPGLGGRIIFDQDFAAEDGFDDDNGHGTNVSAIAAAVAPDADIASLDVFTDIPGVGHRAYDSDIISAINWSIANQSTYNIKAMNLSLGGGQYFDPITASGDSDGDGNDDSISYYTPIEEAKAAGILTIAASGNDGYSDSMGHPAAIDNAISVGAVDQFDNVASFSNSADFLDLLAPGTNITAGGLTLSGTSMATPHVAGAVAVVASAFPTDSPDEIIDKLSTTGTPILDSRNNYSFPRIDLAGALNLDPGNVGDDQYEENDTLADAYSPGYNWEQINLSSINGLGVANDDDWYAIDVGPSGFERVLVDLEFSHANGDIDLELYDASGTVLSGSYSTTDNESIDYTVANPGTYYLRVYPFSGSENTYDLSWDDVPPAGSVDLSGYYFDVLDEPLYAGDSFDVDFEVLNSGSQSVSTFDVEFYISTDSTIESSDYSLGSYSISDLTGNSSTGPIITNLNLPQSDEPFWSGAGEYYIGMIVDPDNTISETSEENNANLGELFDLDPVEILGVGDDAYEENDTFTTAFDPGYDWEQTNLSSINGLGLANDDDWYAIEVKPGSEQIVADLEFIDDNGDIDFELYDAAGSFLTGSYSTTDNESIDYTVADAGTYYLRVYPYSGSENTYDLSWDDVTPTAGADLSGSFFNVAAEPLSPSNSFDVNFEVQNTESDSADGFWVDFYLSTDSTIDSTEDYLLGYQSIDSLTGDSTTGLLSQNLILPDASDPIWNGDGFYYVGMMIDEFDNSVVETDEDNNANTGAFLDYDGVLVNV